MKLLLKKRKKAQRKSLDDNIHTAHSYTTRQNSAICVFVHMSET